MSAELEPFRGPGREWLELMAPAVELAKQIANTEFVPRAMRGNPAAICAAILYGAEVGLGPMQSLARIAVVDGRPTLYAETQRALILAAGHEIWVEESTTTRVTIAGRRRDSDQTTRVTWTMEDARRAKLDGKPTYRAYPRPMLLARASAELARAVFADAIGGLAAFEEVVEDAAPTGPVQLEAVEGGASKPSTKARQRKRASAQVSAGAPERPAELEAERPPLPDEEPAEAPSAPERPAEPERPPLPDEEPASPQAPDEEPAEASPPPSSSAPVAVPMLSDRDRRFLHARKTELGLADEDLKDEIEALTGQRSTTKVPADRLGELLAAMERRSLERAPEAPAPAPEPEPDDSGQLAVDIGRPPHEDRG